MKLLSSQAGLVVTTWALLGLSSAAAFADEIKPRATPSPASPGWSQRMRSLGKSITELLSDLSSDARFNDPKNSARITRNAEEFARLAHEVRADGLIASPDADPSIALIAKEFASEAERAVKALKRPTSREYGRDLLRGMTSYCLACHTRTRGEESFAVLPEPPATLNRFEKASFLASTRRFDRALRAYEEILAQPVAPGAAPFEWERAVRAALALAVRVERDPDRALAILAPVRTSERATVSLQENAEQWRKSLVAWKNESNRASKRTESSLHTEAKRLLEEAKALQKYPADRSADVLYLRASGVLHEQLALAPNGPLSTEALYLIGLCYEVLNGLNLWDLHEYYYQACVLKSPHTPLARQCYRNFEESLIFGYTGSGGTFLPTEAEKRLRALELLSRPVASPPPRP